MCCESDGWEIPTRRAARVNDPSSATATKHSSWRKFIGRAYSGDWFSAHLTYGCKAVTLVPVPPTATSERAE